MSGPPVDPLPDQTPVPPPGWAALQPLVDAVLDAAPEQRAALIEQLSAGDAARRRELEQLVSECERDLPLLSGSATTRFDTLARETESLLPELLAGRYRTERELGRGGMACVYLAHDTKHGRDVAIKVIRPELSASLGYDRFLREIEIAARLRHPNIVPLYDSGEMDGTLYFVMPFEDGPSLRQRLRKEGALPIADALSVLRDVARALAYAHEHGVVHRDVKPDNVMLTGGAAVVADFGIAKAVSVALGGGDDPTLTQAGAGLGTPAYMAPEQAVGDPSTDHRADIYSFGCLAFEVLTGRPPFHGLPAHQIVAAHVSVRPRRVDEIRGEIPEGVATLVAECLEKQPDARPQKVSEVLATLERPRAVETSRWLSRFRRRAVVPATLAIVSVVGVAAWMQSRGGEAGPPISLAILPLGNTATDTAADFLTDGLPDELASALARVPGIQIKSRSGARMYRGQLGVDVTEAGTRLGADHIMTGVVRRDRGRWVVSLDLSRASDRTSLWGDDFALNPEQQTGAVDTITRSLLTTLRTLFPRSIGAAPVIPVRSHTSSSIAYGYYLGGQTRLSRRGLSLRESVDLFRLAIREDSLYAPAYAGLSMALALYPYFERGYSARAVYRDVVTAAERAIALDPTLAQAHVALGLAYAHNLEWNRSEAALQTALRLQPDNVEALIQYGRVLQVMGRSREAVQWLQSARRSDPQSAVITANLAHAYFLQGLRDSARIIIERAFLLDKNLPTRAVGTHILLADGRLTEAKALVKDVETPSAYVAYTLAKTGDTAAANARLRAVEAERPRSAVVETTRALVAVAQNDTARALEALERATDAGEIWFMTEQVTHPAWDPVRGHLRFAAVVRRLKFTRSAAADLRRD